LKSPTYIARDGIAFLRQLGDQLVDLLDQILLAHGDPCLLLTSLVARATNCLVERAQKRKKLSAPFSVSTSLPSSAGLTYPLRIMSSRTGDALKVAVSKTDEFFHCVASCARAGIVGSVGTWAIILVQFMSCSGYRRGGCLKLLPQTARSGRLF
jgi:hypothetical protein